MSIHWIGLEPYLFCTLAHFGIWFLNHPWGLLLALKNRPKTQVEQDFAVYAACLHKQAQLLMTSAQIERIARLLQLCATIQVTLQKQHVKQLQKLGLLQHSVQRMCASRNQETPSLRWIPAPPAWILAAIPVTRPQRLVGRAAIPTC